MPSSAHFLWCSIRPRDIGAGSLALGLTVPEWILESSVEDVTMPITFACSCLCFRASCRSNGSHVRSASALALLSSQWASASREHSYRRSVACSRLFRSAWRFCCPSNSTCCDLSNSTQAFSQLGVLFMIRCQVM